MNTENETNDTVADLQAQADANDPKLRGISTPPMTEREIRKSMSRLDNAVQKRLRSEGLYNTISGRALRNALNAFLNRSTHPMAAALHVALAVDSELRTSSITVGLDRSAVGTSQSPQDTGALNLDPELTADRNTRFYDAPFLSILSVHLPEGTADLPESDLIGMGLVPQGMAGLEQQTQQMVQSYPDRGLLTFYQAFVTFFVDALWRSERLRKNMKVRTFLPNVRLYQMDSTDTAMRFTFDIGVRVQEDGLVEQMVGDGEGAKIEMVPGKVWRFTGECERITISIDPVRMYESARIDQWYPEYYKRFDEAMEKAAEERLAAMAAAEREPEEVAVEDEGVYRWNDAIILPLGSPTLAGRIFPPELLEAQLAEGGQLRGLIERDTVYGEYGAPRRAPGSSGEDWANRVRDVVLENVAVKIENLRVNEARTALIGDIVPFGNHAGLPINLIKGGETPVVAMRSFTVTSPDNDKLVTELRAVVAFDLVANTSTPEMMEELRQKLPEQQAAVAVGFDPAAPDTQDFSATPIPADQIEQVLPEVALIREATVPVQLDPINVARAVDVPAFDGQSK